MKKAVSFALSGLLLISGIGLNYVNAETPSKSISSSQEKNELENKIDKYVDRFIGKNIAGAQITVTKDRKVIFSKGYGLANIEKNIPVTTSTTFNFASVSKLFIWTAAMQLKEQGNLDLNKDIREYLPTGDSVHIKSKKPVTFLNLMNHNAGFESYWKYNEGSGESKDFSSLKEAVYNCYSGIQCFEPDKFQGYSNYGANLAAYILERISGVPFYEYVNEHIFKVCGMNCCYPEKTPVETVMKNKALGYVNKSDGEFKVTKCYSGDWLYPSGSAVGKSEDLALFANALMPKDGLKSPLFKRNETLNEMLSISYTPTGEELFSIHHGFWGTDGNYKGIGHTGCVDGMVSHFLIFPKENLSVSVLVNDENGWDIAFGIPWILTGTDYTEVKDKSNFPDSKILEGEYIHARTQFVNRKNSFIPYKIKCTEKNKIIVTIGKNSQEYIQIRPYIYENITAKSGINFKSKIYFKVENGKVIKATIFKNDLIPMDKLNFIK